MPVSQPGGLTPVALDVRGFIRRMRWLMTAVILFDIVITLHGQPASYWTDPSTVREENEWFHFIMSKGPVVSMVTDIFYLAGSFLLVSCLPARPAIALMSALVLGHFTGGASWLCFHHRLGVQALVIYAAVLGSLIAWIGFSPRPPAPAHQDPDFPSPG
jgi:hypothetical protein